MKVFQIIPWKTSIENPKYVLELQKTFENTEAAKNFMKNFNEENYTDFIVSSNCKKSLVFSLSTASTETRSQKGKESNNTSTI